MSENELMHYGRKGMKWYQHIFGEIDKRAAYASAKLKAASAQRERIKQAERTVAMDRAAASNKKILSRVSDKDLRARIERLKLEEEYRKLVLGDQQKSSKGKSAVIDVLKSFGTTAAAQLGTSFGKQRGKEYEENRSEKVAKKKENKAEAKERTDKIKENISDLIGGTSVGIYTSAQRAKQTYDDIFDGIKFFMKKDEEKNKIYRDSFR